jgi:hypothetical protein
MRDAIPGFLGKDGIGALREMHGNIAAGTVDEVYVDDKSGETRIVGTVVDFGTIRKIRARVLRGLSLGGRVLARDPKNQKIITKVEWTELSAVDRPAALQEAIDKALASGAVPDGFAVVDHRDQNTAVSAGASFGDGFLLIRSTDLEAVASVGFRLAPWPAHVADPEQKPIGNSLPAVPLAVVKHPDPSVTTERGHALGGGFRLIAIATDLKYLNSLGWQPAVWPAP